MWDLLPLRQIEEAGEMHSELSVPTKGFAVTFAVRNDLLAVVQNLRGLL